MAVMGEAKGKSERLVFISYSVSDRRIAEAIRAYLEKLDVECWMAPESIMPGESWATAISHAITRCRVMILLWTSESMQSSNVVNELTLADRSGVMILPFRVDEVEPEGAFKFYLYKTHWLDAYDNWRQKLNVLGERVLHNLRESDISESSPSTVLCKRAYEGLRLRPSQYISTSLALLALVAALAAIAIPNLSRKPAVEATRDNEDGDQLAQCEVIRDTKKIINGECRFRQFGGNGSFSLYPLADNGLTGGMTSLTLTVTSKGVGEVRALVRDGNAITWGVAKQELLHPACWKGTDFRLCIYAL